MTYTDRTFLGFYGLLIVLFFSLPTLAQNSVGIGTRDPNPNAALQVVGNGAQGVMIPGLTSQQRSDAAFTSSLTSEENGLLVYDTEEQRFYYWMDDSWKALVSGSLVENLTAGQGITLIGESEISNTGDIDATDDITTSTQASGDLGGTFPELSIVADAVTTEKLAEGAVTTEKVADNSLLPQDLASPGAGKVLISTSAGTVFWENQTLFGLTFLPQGNVYVGNSGNQPAALELKGAGNILVGNGTSVSAVSINGDISLNGTGNIQIQPGVVTSVEIADGQVGSDDIANDAVVSDKLAAGAVTSDKLALASVSGDKLADNAVNSIKIADGAVTGTKLADNTVDGSKIADGTIGSAEIADGSIVDLDISTAAAIAGEKINPDFGSQNLVTTGNVSAQSATFSGKATTDLTVDTDPANTLTTKGYVDGELAAISQPLEDGDGIADFTYNGNISATISVDAGRGLGLDAGQVVVDAGAGLGFEAGGALQVTEVTSDMITDGALLNADISSIAAIEVAKLQSLGNANLLIGDGTTNNAVPLSGDASLNSAGELTLANTVAARTNLGLGTLAVQNADNVSLDGGAITNVAIDNSIIGATTPAAGTFTTVVATNLLGDGSSIVNINADNIASGTLAETRLPASGVTAGTYGGSGGEFVESVTVDATGRITGITSGLPASDVRLKENIQPMGSTLQQLMLLVPAQYSWKNQDDSELSYGLIAQELASVYPHLVKQRSDGFFGVNYMELIPVLLKAMQEQQQQIENLQVQVAVKKSNASAEPSLQDLQDENRQLRQEIEAIKAALGLETKASRHEE
jgi:hypothetical protein